MGKTNLIEALNLLSSTKSFKAQRDSEMINWEKEFGRVFAVADSIEIEMIIKKGGKEINLNHVQTRALDVVGVISSILFTPGDISLLTESPSSRRRFLDILISKINRRYLYDLAQYSFVLKSRNKLLFSLREGFGSWENLSVWNKSLIELGARLISSRLSYLSKIQEKLSFFGQRLLQTQVCLEYETKFKKLNTLEEITGEYEELLKRAQKEEIEKATTLIGPHRDDFKVLIKQENKLINAAIFGSRGEVRSILLALKFAEVGVTQEEKKEGAILLLDDVLSELDKNHQLALLDLVKENQAFITTTNLDIFPESFLRQATVWKVDEGKIWSRQGKS